MIHDAIPSIDTNFTSSQRQDGTDKSDPCNNAPAMNAEHRVSPLGLLFSTERFPFDKLEAKYRNE